MISGKEALDEFADKIAECLPTPKRWFEAETALQKLDALKASPVHRLAPVASQKLLAHVLKIINALCEGRAVPITNVATDEHAGHCIEI